MREFPGFKKGVNLGGWLSQSPLTKEHMDAFITEKDLEAIASIGADHVRLPVDYPLVETEDGTDKEEGYRYIDNCVAWCKKYGLHMLLDLHKAFGYSFGNAANCGSFFENANLQERFLSLWEKFAKRYGNYDFVAFDLLNEVVDPDISDAWNDLAKRAVERIRKLTGEELLDFLFREAVSVAEARNVPLYCGEYGVINHADPVSALAWQTDFHNVCEKYGIGRALWSYKRMSFGLVDEHYKEVFDELVKVL